MSKKPIKPTEKPSTSPLPRKLPPGFTDKTAEAIGTVYGIVGVGVSKPPSSK